MSKKLIGVVNGNEVWQLDSGEINILANNHSWVKDFITYCCIFVASWVYFQPDTFFNAVSKIISLI